MADGDYGASLNATASSAAIRVEGNIGNDSFIGGAGNDTISGDNGNDTITGGAGADVLNGGDGADVFVFGNAAGVAPTNFNDNLIDNGTQITVSTDVIVDFHSVDKLQAVGPQLIGLYQYTKGRVLANDVSYVLYGTYLDGYFQVTNNSVFGSTDARDALLITNGEGRAIQDNTSMVVLKNLNSELSPENFSGVIFDYSIAPTRSVVVGNGASISGADIITEFISSTDVFKISSANKTSIDTVGLLTSSVVWSGNWDSTVSNAFNNAAMASNYVLLMTVTGTNAGTYLVLNDHNLSFDSAADAVIVISETIGTLTGNNFIA
jgi:hypothetical protein